MMTTIAGSFTTKQVQAIVYRHVPCIVGDGSRKSGLILSLSKIDYHRSLSSNTELVLYGGSFWNNKRNNVNSANMITSSIISNNNNKSIRNRNSIFNNKKQQIVRSGSQYRTLSSSVGSTATQVFVEEIGPTGELFDSSQRKRNGTDNDVKTVTENSIIIGQSGSINRVFGPRDNTDALLATGGEELAAHASFDPNYTRAQGWIRQHAVGPAVLSPILIQGLIGSLTEAAFPEGVVIKQSTIQYKPLIVGVPVKATIQVTNVQHSTRCMNEHAGDEKNGYTIDLQSSVTRIRDDELIVNGTITLWIPDYENM